MHSRAPIIDWETLYEQDSSLSLADTTKKWNYRGSTNALSTSQHFVTSFAALLTAIWTKWQSNCFPDIRGHDTASDNSLEVSSYGVLLDSSHNKLIAVPRAFSISGYSSPSSNEFLKLIIWYSLRPSPLHSHLDDRWFASCNSIGKCAALTPCLLFLSAETISNNYEPTNSSRIKHVQYKFQRKTSLF